MPDALAQFIDCLFLSVVLPGSAVRSACVCPTARERGGGRQRSGRVRTHRAYERLRKQHTSPCTLHFTFHAHIPWLNEGHQNATSRANTRAHTHTHTHARTHACTHTHARTRRHMLTHTLYLRSPRIAWHVHPTCVPDHTRRTRTAREWGAHTCLVICSFRRCC